jgi:hypothetical protein
MSMQQDVAATWRLVSQGGGWRALAALLGLMLMVGGMIALMWFQSQPVVDDLAWLCGALSVAGLVLWKYMLARQSRR